MAAKSKRRKHPPTARSIRSLARQVSRSESAVRRWIRHERWPFPLEGPWDVRRVKAWAEIQLHPDPAAAFRQKAKAAELGLGEFRDLGPIGKARLQVLIGRAMLQQHRLKVEQGKVHDVAVCGQRLLRLIHEVKARLLELPRAVAGVLVGQPAEAIERLLAEQVNGILMEFSNRETTDASEE